MRTQRSPHHGRNTARPTLRTTAGPIEYAVARRRSPDEGVRGGDVLEVCTRPDGSTALFLADLSSKGPISSVHAALLRSSFRSAAYLERSPARLMTTLNGLRFGTPTPSFGVTFATALIVEIDRIGPVFRYASAGHDIGILVRGRVHRHTTSTGPILGVFDGAAYAERTEAFDGDDLLILATDGFTECRSFPHGERQFGTAGIVQALSQRLAHSPSAAATHIAQRADVFTGGQYRDDATLVALARRTPAAAASRIR